ncbi:MAG TPA: hypothetical protein VNF68_08620 [Candidatus Baltobacteraceae bacterium]|nr:hypothetical protein [Candidatus Baltobacteraceae bacterium]
MMRHRPPSAGVTPNATLRLIEGSKEIIRVDKLRWRVICALEQFGVVDDTFEIGPEQTRDVDPEGVGDAAEHIDPDVGLGALNARDRRPRNAGPLRKLALGKARLRAYENEIVPEELSSVFHGGPP